MAVASNRPWSPHTGASRRWLLAVAAISAAAWCSSVSFVGSRGRPETTSSPRVQRQAGGYTFGINKADDHKGLLTAEKDNAYRISTDGSFDRGHFGHYNTVLGDQEIPQSGRSYWEVKIVKKPSDAFEFIGVAEPSTDVTVPLHKNRKGKGWFWGGDHEESFVYTFMEMKPGMNDRKMAEHQRIADVATWDFTGHSGMALPPISPRTESSASSPRKELKGDFQLPALRDVSMTTTTKRMRALAQKQANQCIPQYMDLPKMLPLLLEEGPDLILQP
eukprot:symbB.v1.2.010584.t2/scaffold686.1/size316167/3